DGAADAGHAEEVLLRLLDTLGDGEGHLLRLAVADTDGAVAVAHHDERGEAEATAALDDLRHAVDGHDALEELALAAIASAALATGTAVTAAATLLAGLVAVILSRRLGGLSLSRHFLLLRFVAHRASPPSRAPSAIAATRPAYLLPPRSKTTAVTPAVFARSATSSPTLRAFAVLSPSNTRRSASMVDADASVWPFESSITWTNTWRAERVTTRRGRSS